MAPERKAVIHALKVLGKPSTPSVLAVGMGKALSATKKLCAQMLKDGQLTQPQKKGHYWVAE